jgi:MFS family permease
VSIVRWLELLAFGVYVFDVTQSPMQVAMMTVLRMAPLALAGMFSGAIAELVNRRGLMLVGVVAMTIQSLALGLWSLHSDVPIWVLGVASFLNGVFWTTDFSARRTIMAEVVGTRNLGVAMSLDSITNNGTRMVGPALGGLLLQHVGLTGAFFLGVALYGATIVALLKLKHQEPAERHGDKTSVLQSIMDGLAYVRTNRALTGTLMVTVVFNIWGFPMTAMVPVVGKDILELSPFPVGLLVSAEGAGATIGALLITAFGRPDTYKKLYFFGVFLYLNMILLFSHTLWAGLSGTWLLILGLGGAAFASMQPVLVISFSKPEFRSRSMGVLAVCIGTGPIGFVHLGLLADWVGAQQALAIMAIEGIVALLIVAIVWPEVE